MYADYKIFFLLAINCLLLLIPEHTFIGFNWKSQQNVKNLILGGRNSEPYEEAVLIRERLREALGVEDSIEEHIKRCIFCWWLHTYFDEIVSGDPIEGQVIADPNPTAIEDSQKLILWPFMKKGKGLDVVSGYVEAYRLVISAAKNGATPEDIVDTMRSYLGFEQSPPSRRSISNNVRRVGFLEHKA